MYDTLEQSKTNRRWSSHVSCTLEQSKRWNSVSSRWNSVISRRWSNLCYKDITLEQCHAGSRSISDKHTGTPFYVTCNDGTASTLEQLQSALEQR